MDKLFFNNTESLLRTVLIGLMAYPSVLLLLRISGKRTLSKMNVFDFIVTVALGSILGTILLNKNVPLADGLLAFGVLVGLQFLITWTSVRVPWVRKVVTGEPTLLYYHGEYLSHAMERQRVRRDEIESAARGAGEPNLNEVQAVVLETDGSLSVVRQEGELSEKVLGVELPSGGRPAMHDQVGSSC